MMHDDSRIEALDLTVRTYNCLKRGRIDTVHQLLSLRKHELLSLRNLRPEDYEEIRERLIACKWIGPMQSIGPFTSEEEDGRE
jgi:DNA-directed RNA polymerase alpha subunit